MEWSVTVFMTENCLKDKLSFNSMIRSVSEIFKEEIWYELDLTVISQLPREDFSSSQLQLDTFHSEVLTHL